MPFSAFMDLLKGVGIPWGLDSRIIPTPGNKIQNQDMGWEILEKKVIEKQ